MGLLKRQRALVHRGDALFTHHGRNGRLYSCIHVIAWRGPYRHSMLCQYPHCSSSLCAQTTAQLHMARGPWNLQHELRCSRERPGVLLGPL